MSDSLRSLRARLAEIADLKAAAALLEWDQETYMPSGAGSARAAQLGSLYSLAHQRFTDGYVADLVEAVVPESEVDEALLRVTRYDLDRATVLPSAHVARFARATAHAREAWKAARTADNFHLFAPHLQTLIELSRDKAELLAPVVPNQAGPDQVYDILLDEYEPGASTSELAAIFERLRTDLVPFVEAIAATGTPDDSLWQKPYEEEAQWRFGLEVGEAFGYDLERGRQDRSAHPFSTSFSISDVRVTTRIDAENFPTGFFGTLHEVGHALYEQGIDPAFERTPVASGTSLGVHESQSRLWENHVGRSRSFWEYWLPRFKENFPSEDEIDVEDIYRAVNIVRPSLIRVEADELTYHLHVLLRFELERALLRGDLAVQDLPAAWNDGMKRYLGMAPPNDADGCLQDIHWSLGALAYFPTYTLGTLLSAQLFDAATRELGDIGQQVGSGNYEPLLAWLRENVHRFGRSKSAAEITTDATGHGLSAEPWLAYARAKYGALYDLS